MGSLLSGLGVAAVPLSAGSSPTAVLDGCDLILGIPQGEQGEQGETGANGSTGQTGKAGTPGYGLPDPNDEDAICYIATTLAIYVSDDCQDFLEGLDFSTTIFNGTFVNAVDKLASFIPTMLGFGIDEAFAWTLEAAYTATEAAIDYLRENLTDIEVRDQAANWIYCALKESLEVEDGNVSLVNFPINLANQVGVDLVEIPVSVVDNAIDINLGSIISDLSGAPNKAIAGYVIGWFIMQEYIINQLLGLGDGYRTMIATAYGAAEYFDSRNCASFEGCDDWCYSFDFAAGQQGWNAQSAEYGSWQGTHFGVGTDNHTVIANIDIGEETILTKVQVFASGFVGGVAASEALWNDFGFVSGSNFYIFSGSARNGWEWEGEETLDKLQVGANSGTSDTPDAQISQIILFGKGSNPFGSDNCG